VSGHLGEPDLIERAIVGSDIVERTVDKLVRQRMESEERVLMEWLRTTFRDDATVIRVEKPRWMPERAYRWLWRTIVREEKV